MPYTLLLALAGQAMAPDPALLAEMQAVESARNAAIRAGDEQALSRLYAPDFHGIAASGARVDRPALFAIFRRNAGSAVIADSVILDARRVGETILAEGRLRLLGDGGARLPSESLFLHVFRRNGDHWEMVSGAATPVAGAAD